MPDHQVFLKVKGNQIQNQAGQLVTLQGVGLGGWMNMENFITGFPANEEAFRRTVRRTLGRDKAEYFFDRYLDCFFTEEDARFIRSLGHNLVRLPFNYRHFEEDMNPMVIRESGFKPLDQAIRLCADQGIYTILDLHAAPGYQNQDWHSDNPTHQALFWDHKHFQDRTVWLWEVLADRYKDNPWVAGYNPLNEPSDPTRERLDPFYRRVVSAIRAVDPAHIIFLEGDHFGRDFSPFGEPLPNTVYAIHNYAVPGFIDGGDYPGLSWGEYFDKTVLRDQFLHTCRYMFENGTPIWVGEFGPVYTGDARKDAMRYRLLQDQLSIYQEFGIHWSLWTYKDLGLHGVVNLREDSNWVRKIKPVLDRKALLGVDSWGGSDEHIRPLLDPIEQAFAEYYPDYQPFPFNARWQINRVVRHILLAEPLVEDFKTLLQGLTLEDIDALTASFQFKNCLPRQPLIKIIQEPYRPPARED